MGDSLPTLCPYNLLPTTAVGDRELEQGCHPLLPASALSQPCKASPPPLPPMSCAKPWPFPSPWALHLHLGAWGTF